MKLKKKPGCESWLIFTLQFSEIWNKIKLNENKNFQINWKFSIENLY